jgi:hypothetical protein
MNHEVLPTTDTNEGFGDSLFTRIVKAGHRTYFIDVKATRTDDLFLSLTELRKKTTASGVVTERNKVFIFKEDLEKFSAALNEVVAKVTELSK